MLFFPQLRSYGLVQFPFSRQESFRVVRATTPSGLVHKYFDSAARSSSWHLQLAGLTDSERLAIHNLFVSVRGSLDYFTFLDPFENLLAYSEDFSEACWDVTAGTILAPNQVDPLGTSKAFRCTNLTDASGDVGQNLQIAGWFMYTFSIWIRSTAPASKVDLVFGPPSDPQSQSFAVDQTWTRLQFSGRAESLEREIVAAIRLQPHSEIDIFGSQLEPLPNATPYKLSTARHGVHTKCRFADDEITWKTVGVNSHSTEFTLISN